MKKISMVNRRSFIKKSIHIGAAGYLPLSSIPLFNSCNSSQINNKWQIGIYTRPWDQFDYLTALDAIATADFSYVGLMTTMSETRLVITPNSSLDYAKKVGEEIRKRNLTLISVYGGNFEVDTSLNHGIKMLKKLIDNCSAAGAQSLLLAGTADAEIFDDYIQSITSCSDYAQEKGIMITLKPHGGLNADGPQLRAISEKIDHANFKIFYDPGNIYYYSDGTIDPLDDVTTICDEVVGMCVKDYLHPKNVMVTPGQGLVNFPELFRKMYKMGFQRGPLMIECLKKSPDQQELIREAVKAREFLEGLLKNLETD